MKKGIYFIGVIFIALLLTSCKPKEKEISFINLTLTSENTYTGYFEGDTINLNNFIETSYEYTIICNEESFSSNEKRLFDVSSNYITFFINLDDTYRIDFYKNETVLTKAILPNGEIIQEELPLGSTYNSFNVKIEEKASNLGYLYNGYVTYTFENETYEEVLLKDLIVLGSVTYYPVFTPLENEVLIDGVKYTFVTGEKLDLSFLEKVGYNLLPFDNDFAHGNKYYKTMGTSFNTTYEPINYQVTLEYLDKEETFDQTFDLPINLKDLTIDGYDFLGWYLEDSLYTDTVYKTPSNITLKAKLVAKTFVITLTNIDEPIKINVTYNEPFTLPEVVKEGYIFLGWEYNEKEFNKDVYTYTKDIELVATWMEKVEDVSVNLETFGGECITLAQCDKDGNLVIDTPIKENYKFVGWYYDDALKVPAGTIKASTYNNETLYAKYTYDSSETVGEFVITRLNNHASDYSELVIFDKTQSGFTSKYWHKVGISKTNNGYVISGIAQSGESLSSLGDYDFVILAYSAYEYYNDFVKANYLLGYEVFFTVDPTSLESGKITSIVSFVAPNVEEDKEEIKEELDLLYKDIECLSGNIDLVTTVKGYNLTWKSSNISAVSNDGVYTIPHVTRNVTLSAYVGDTLVYSFNFDVLGKQEESTALSTGYIYSPYDITQNAMDTLDIIYTAFLEIDYKGDWVNLSNMKSNLNYYILPKAKISGTKVVVSINQHSSGNFSKVVHDEELRTKLINNILQFIIEMGIDGVDIDWETPSKDEAEYFTILMKELYTAVKAYDEDLLVTAAIGGGTWAPPCYDLPNSKNYMDYINLMTYSMAKSNGYYQNSLYKSSKGATLISCSIAESIEIYNDLGVKNSQILVGIPFYCTMQEDCGGPGSRVGTGKSVSYSYMLDYYPLSDTMIEYFDEECGVPYRYDETTKVFFSYDNERSIKLKCDYINTLGLAGIMYWQYGQDVDDMLTNAIAKYINE